MSDAGTYLDRILADKRTELSALRAGRSSALSDAELSELGTRLPRPRDLIAALRQVRPRPAVIAEFKRASPLAGVLRPDADPRSFATLYAAAGAAALSVVTDRHFQGSFDDLRAIRQTVTLPLVCRDLILERWQIVEAKRTGADAVVLIVAALPAPLLRQLIDFAHDLDMHVLAEAHDEAEIERAMAAGARLIGAHARDLRTSQVDLDRVLRLRPLVPSSFTFLVAGGLSTLADLRRLQDADVDAALLGAPLMKAERPGDALRELIEGL